MKIYSLILMGCLISGGAWAMGGNAPVSKQFPDTANAQPEALKHWKLLVEEEADPLLKALTIEPETKDLPVYVEIDGGGSIFEKTIADLLKTELSKRGLRIAVANTDKVATVQVSSMIIRHADLADDSSFYPKGEVLLTMGVPVGNSFIYRKAEVFYFNDRDKDMFKSVGAKTAPAGVVSFQVGEPEKPVSVTPKKKKSKVVASGAE